MDLQNFIKETLVQIVDGIADAQNSVEKTGAIISPKVSENFAHKGLSGMLPVAGKPPATVVAFDVALTATEGTDTKGGIGVVAGIVNLGTTGQSSNENTSFSRVQFNVPVILPPALYSPEIESFYEKNFA